MAYFIKDSCVSCDFCLEECPTSCISQGIHKLVIDTDLCVNCGICVLVCPVEAVEGEVFDPEKSILEDSSS